MLEMRQQSLSSLDGLCAATETRGAEANSEYQWINTLHDAIMAVPGDTITATRKQIFICANTYWHSSYIMQRDIRRQIHALGGTALMRERLVKVLPL